MEILAVGSLNGEVDRLKGLVEVSDPELTLVLGPIGAEEPVKLGRRWFYVHGKDENLEALSSSDGIDILSRIFRFKDITFSGLSGYIHPQMKRFTRREWAKLKGKFSSRYSGYVFQEDIVNIKTTFENLNIERLDIFLTLENPRKREIMEIVEITRPRFVLYPSSTFSKVSIGETTAIGLEPASSPRGKYVLRF